MIIKFRLPYNGANQRLLLEDVAGEFAGLSPSDLDIVVYDNHTIGVQVKSVDAENVTQSQVDMAVSSVRSTLGGGVDVIGWGEPPV